jgi:CheY-like chemotaxis protein
MSQAKILIAEDESRVAQALSRALSLPEGGGYSIESYGTGNEAPARLRENYFDLLITDMRMPGMSGLELIAACREISPTMGSILITGFSSTEIEAQARRLAVDAFLTKPFSMRSLVQVVQKTLKARSERAVSPPLAPLSKAGHAAIRKSIEALRQDTNARNVLLLDRSGELLAESGPRGEFDTGAFLAALGNTMVVTNAVSEILGDSSAFDLHFHEGEKYEIYSARVSPQVFLSLLLEREDTNGRIGMVWLYLRRAVTDLRQLLLQSNAETAVTVRTAIVVPAKSGAAVASRAVLSPSIEDPKAVISYAQAKALGLLGQNAARSQSL